MLTKIREGWWIDLGLVTFFTRDRGDGEFYYKDYPNPIWINQVDCNLLENKLNEFYGNKHEK